MKNDKLYQLLVTKMNEVAVVPPQEAGPFTFIYRKTASYFKSSLWKSTLFVALLLAVFLYLLLGPTLVKLVSILQFGF